MNLLPAVVRSVNVKDRRAMSAHIKWCGVLVDRLFDIQEFDEITGFAVVRGSRPFNSSKWRVFKEPIIMIFPGAKIVYDD